MAMKRFIKASLRLLRFKVTKDLERYQFLTYPVQQSATDLQKEKPVGIVVVFFGEEESQELSKTLEAYWSQNANLEIAIITVFSDINTLNALQDRHRNQKLTIYNIFCLADSEKLQICLKKNCQIEAAKITEEEYYHKIVQQSAKKYQKKHSAQQDADDLDEQLKKSL